MRKRKIIKILSGVVLFSALGIGAGILTPQPAAQAASSVKVRYNGKTYKNKSKKMNVKYNSKKVSNNSYKALIIKKSYMAPYDDIFKKGVKATCKYTKSTKTLTIKKNAVTIKMKVGSKTAYVNNAKVKLPVAPLSVKYVSKKKTKILVPLNYVAKTLHLGYSKSGSTITLTSPLKLKYDNVVNYYTGVQGSLYYNHTNYKLSTMPVIKINGNMYMPAEEAVSNILKLGYDYNAATGKISIVNEDIDIHLECTVNSNIATVNKKQVKLSAPVKVIENVTKKTSVVCLPASGILKQLNYTRSWNKSGKYYMAQSKKFFDWKKALTSAQKKASGKNYLYEALAEYTEQSGTGSINLSFTGSSADLMSKAVVKRNSKTISITLPSASSVLDKNQFANFGEMISKMDIVAGKDGSLEITLDCNTVMDYSYIIKGNTLILNVLYTYSDSNGSVTNYSLSIPKPNNITIQKVTNQDLYASKKFQIIIQGNHTAFFASNPIVINNNTIKGVDVSLSGNNTVITVTTSSLRGYKIYEKGSNLVVSVGAPKDIYKSIVVLDAGHGGYDPGAQNKGTNEKDLTYKIAYTLMKKYCSGNAPDIKVYWTRTTDKYVTLANRAAFAKSVGADAFISLHMNSASSSSANGTEVYYSTSNNSTGFGGITSKKMATLFKNRLVTDLKTKSRGVKSAGYYVIKHNTVPAILIELGFISGSTDYSNLTKSSFQEKAAKSIYDGIVSMFSTYKTGR